MQFAEELKQHAIFRIRRSAQRIEHCFAWFDESEIWEDLSPHLMSPGNHLLHCMGNISQHICAGLGDIPYVRDRSNEFTAKPAFTKHQLLNRLSTTIDQAIHVITDLTDAELVHEYVIQGHRYSGIGDILAVVEHLAYHVGQLAFAVKQKKQIEAVYGNHVDWNQSQSQLLDDRISSILDT